MEPVSVVEGAVNAEVPATTDDGKGDTIQGDALVLPSVKAYVETCNASLVAKLPVTEQVQWFAAWSVSGKNATSTNRARMLERFVLIAEHERMVLKLHPAKDCEFASYPMPRFHFGTLDKYASTLWASSDWETQRGFFKSLVGNMATAAVWIDAAIQAGKTLNFSTYDASWQNPTTAKAYKWATALVEAANKYTTVEPPPVLLDGTGVVRPSGKRKRPPSVKRGSNKAVAAEGTSPSSNVTEVVQKMLTESSDESSDEASDGVEERVWLELVTPKTQKSIDIPEGLASGKKRFQKLVLKFCERYDDGFYVKLFRNGNVVAAIEM